MRTACLHPKSLVDQERWLPVVGYEGAYEVSGFGRVRSLDRLVPHGKGDGMRRCKGRMLRPGRMPSGHMSVVLGHRGSVCVHVLVLRAFVGECPTGHESLHWDDDGSNNKLSNLRWGTRSENVLDAIRNGGRIYKRKSMGTCIVQVRKPGKKRSFLLMSKGGLTRLRVHAVRFEDRESETGEQRAQTWIATNAALNPGCQFKVVSA